jgi:Pyridoxamine 5'-phosphate oxidase
MRYDFAMELSQFVAFMRQSRLAVQASVSPESGPQAALIGFVVSDAGELFFDTSNRSRKYQNLLRDSRVALVIGWQEQTLQYEGLADQPTGAVLERFKALYFASFADGPSRERWPDIAYFRVRPRWLRYSDFRGPVPNLSELDLV